MKINCMGADKSLFSIDVNRLELERLAFVIQCYLDDQTNPGGYKDEQECLRQINAALQFNPR